MVELCRDFSICRYWLLLNPILIFLLLFSIYEFYIFYKSLGYIKIKIYFLMLLIRCNFSHRFSIYSLLFYCHIVYDVKQSKKIHWRMHHRLMTVPMSHYKILSLYHAGRFLSYKWEKYHSSYPSYNDIVTGTSLWTNRFG